jgi:hypothetical protein
MACHRAVHVSDLSDPFRVVGLVSPDSQGARSTATLGCILLTASRSDKTSCRVRPAKRRRTDSICIRVVRLRFAGPTLRLLIFAEVATEGSRSRETSDLEGLKKVSR